ncbi:unnamed protein product [Paramecium sonneborni]|uniref:Protein kinase domain-containing protein n=1 Tax=Paramecium sonneborni TaxID=65129 RepID=A0A8S1RAD4_9CILI|nr:unnamed protein product [Paramecium sonneborni]
MQQQLEQNIRKQGDYQFDSKYLLGEGAFGKVYRGNKISTNIEVTIKKIDSSMINKDQYQIDALNSEIQIMKQLDHPNIVKFIDKFATDRSIQIVTEFYADGDLRNIMKGRKIPEIEVNQIFCQLACGFKQQVKANIIHRDLKPANIMNHRGTVKIADFSFSKIVDNFSGDLLRTCVGSPLYMASQILEKEKYTTKSDIWYEMIYGHSPWTSTDEKNLTENIMKQLIRFHNHIQLSDFEETLLLKLQKKKNLKEWNGMNFFLFEQQKRQLPQTNIKFAKNRIINTIIDNPIPLQINEVQNQQFINQINQLNLQRIEITQNITIITQYYKKNYNLNSYVYSQLNLLLIPLNYYNQKYFNYQNLIKNLMNIPNISVNFKMNTNQLLNFLPLPNNIQIELVCYLIQNNYLIIKSQLILRNQIKINFFQLRNNQRKSLKCFKAQIIDLQRT